VLAAELHSAWASDKYSVFSFFSFFRSCCTTVTHWCFHFLQHCCYVVVSRFVRSLWRLSVRKQEDYLLTYLLIISHKCCGLFFLEPLCIISRVRFVACIRILPMHFARRKSNYSDVGTRAADACHGAADGVDCAPRLSASQHHHRQQQETDTAMPGCMQQASSVRRRTSRPGRKSCVPSTFVSRFNCPFTPAKKTSARWTAGVPSGLLVNAD